MLEYLTSYAMEKLFHMRWWDYSQFKLQINGRVCLLNSTLFGLACVFLCHIANPPISAWAESLFARGMAPAWFAPSGRFLRAAPPAFQTARHG